MSGIGVGISPVLGVFALSSSGAPAVPANLALAIGNAPANDEIDISWDASAGATLYRVRYGTNGTDWTEVDTTAGTTYTLTSADFDIDAVTHYVEVRAESGGGNSAYAQATIDGDLVGEVGRWLMDEASGNALDDIGTLDLTDTNTVGAGSDAFGNYREFVAANQERFNRTDNAIFSMGAGVRMTLAIWAYPDSVTGTQVLVEKRSTGSNLEYQFFLSNQTMAFFVTSNGLAGTLVQVQSGSVVATGAWQWLVAQYNGATISVNRNNGTAATAAFSADIFNGTSDVNIGGRPGGIEPYDGRMKKMRLWKRALSAGQLAKVYAEGP